jgi:hypothetical protein
MTDKFKISDAYTVLGENLKIICAIEISCREFTQYGVIGIEPIAAENFNYIIRNKLSFIKTELNDIETVRLNPKAVRNKTCSLCNITNGHTFTCKKYGEAPNNDRYFPANRSEDEIIVFFQKTMVDLCAIERKLVKLSDDLDGTFRTHGTRGYCSNDYIYKNLVDAIDSILNILLHIEKKLSETNICSECKTVSGHLFSCSKYSIFLRNN